MAFDRPGTAASGDGNIGLTLRVATYNSKALISSKNSRGLSGRGNPIFTYQCSRLFDGTGVKVILGSTMMASDFVSFHPLVNTPTVKRTSNYVLRFLGHAENEAQTLDPKTHQHKNNSSLVFAAISGHFVEDRKKKVIGEIMETIIDPSNSASPSTGELIKDSSDAEFVTDVIEGSKQVPVIVDFWAPWCGPCKQLGPTLEKVISEAGGAVKLVKIDIDQNPQVAQQLRIQSIPAVYAFYQGRPVDGFQGALPESQLKDFVKKLTDAAGSTQTSPIDEALAQAKALVEAGEKTQAEMLYEQVLQHDPGNSEAAINLARLSMESGESERARNLIEGLSDEAKKSPEATSVISALALAEKAGDGANLASLRAASEANPGDHQARLDLAVALFGLGEREAGIDEILEIIRRDRKWNDDAARIQLLEFFEALGPTDELTVQGRKRLSSILFS